MLSQRLLMLRMLRTSKYLCSYAPFVLIDGHKIATFYVSISRGYCMGFDRSRFVLEMAVFMFSLHNRWFPRPSLKQALLSGIGGGLGVLGVVFGVALYI